ncbi:MAG TPA: restriction endonuclease subunit S [Myxococcota bacterium]|nr:restriction endonuclease subunit S [Myxococcota bacterium]HQK50406.1 restriction endonuclease subunit S [Myxococcota bacterium]
MTEFEQSEHYPIDLDHLPKGWEVAWVGDLCQSIQSGFASGEHNSDGIGVPHLRPMNVDRGGRLNLTEVKHVLPSSDARRLARGDVLFNNTNSPVLIGKTCPIMTDRELAFSNHMTRLRPGEGIDTRFLAHELHYLWMAGFFLHKCQKHVNQASISTDVLASTVPLAVPPTPEQQRIVAAIEDYFSRLDQAVALLERVQRNLKRYRASVLKAAVEGRLVPTEAELARAEGRDYEPASVLLQRILEERRRRWKAEGRRGTYKEPVAPDTSNLPELPEGWCWASLPQLGELNRGKSRHRPRNDARLLGGPYPFIQTGEVRRSEGFIETHDATYSEFGLAQSRLWPKGTLCITIAANIAATGILKFDACFPDSVVGFLNTEEPLLTRYLELFIRTERDELTRFAPATAQKNINLETLRDVAVPLPPAAEQVRLVGEIDRQLSVIRQLEASAELGIARIARTRQSILKWAFEGRLVDQDPTDEPAHVLLDRIRAERATRQGAPSRRKAGRGPTRRAEVG